MNPTDTDTEPTLLVTTFEALAPGTPFRQQLGPTLSHARYRKINATEARIITLDPDTDPVVPIPATRNVVIATLAPRKPSSN